MSAELQVLALVSLWGIVVLYIASAGRLRVGGVQWGLGNRESDPVFPAWVARAERAYRNHAENWPLYVGAALALHLSGRATETTALAAWVFLGARIAHTGLYVAGVTVARTAAYYVSLGALGLMYLRALGG